jgi:ACS family tartrate transporter-like MFS transporter
MGNRSSLDSVLTVDADAASDRSLEPIFRRIGWRIVPVLVLLYVVAFLDRVNVGFASLTMNRDLGISDSAYGLAAGVFFAGYLLFSVPSNIMLARLGAGRWIGTIMVVWGVVSSMQAFVHNATTYTIARFLIGAAEAGFFPGIILYITMWLPRSRRTSVMGLFTVSIPLAAIIGAPISTHLMELAGRYCMRGWQWLFLLEGLPAVLLGLAVPRLLASGPENVLWLSPREKIDLLGAIDSEENIAALSGSSRNILSADVRPVYLEFLDSSHFADLGAFSRQDRMDYVTNFHVFRFGHGYMESVCGAQLVQSVSPDDSIRNRRHWVRACQH